MAFPARADTHYTTNTYVVDIRNRQTVETINHQIRGRESQAQRWDVFAEIRGESARQEILVHQATHGVTTPFLLPMPQDMKALGALATHNVRIGGAVAAGANSIALVPTVTTAVAGQYVSFDNHKKVYLITAMTDDKRTATITPSILKAVGSGDKMILDPYLWCVYAATRGFRTQETEEGSKWRRQFTVREYLE